MRKTEVILFLVSILLVSTVYSIEGWPDNVPYGSSFHEILYTDVIDSADDDNLIQVSANLDLLDGVYYGNGSGLYGLDLTRI